MYRKKVIGFLKKYYKKSRSIDRGQEYFDSLVESYTKELLKSGYCFMSHHDSNNGNSMCLYKVGDTFKTATLSKYLEKIKG